jgi:hypothetical protein
MIANLFSLSIIVIMFLSACGPSAPAAVDAQPTQTAAGIQSPAPAGSSTPVPSLAVDDTTAMETTTPAAEQVSGISLTFLSDGDAYVKQAEPDANYGGEKSLRVDSESDASESFVHFSVPALAGPVQNAILRLYSGTKASTNGPVAYAVDTSWLEDEITWNNRPVHEGLPLDNKDKITEGTWVEYNVTSAVKGLGAYTFVLTADSGDAVAFSSKEGDWAPELVVTYIPIPTPTLSAEDVILVGAGNISTCTNDKDELTAQLLDNIPGTVFTAGDNVYDEGTYQEFIDCYGPTWGRHKDRTYPTPGKQEYDTQDASGYFQYFNNIPSYYAYDLGNWRIYALNSEASVGENSKQAKWLKIDLATHPSQCVLAYWNTPRWSSGEKHGSNPDMQVLWQILYESGAELVINGLEQNYERFERMNPAGQPDPNGVREIVVGTGGADLDGFGPSLPTSEVRDNSTYGVLKLTLRTSSYDWQFVAVDGSTFTDSGNTACH